MYVRSEREVETFRVTLLPYTFAPLSTPGGIKFPAEIPFEL